jgi:hypothetical protein
MKPVALSLAALWLGVSSRAGAEVKCAELEGVKAQVQLEYLHRNRSAQDAPCIAYATIQLGFGQDPDVIKTLVGLLDYRSPDDLKGARQMVVGQNADPYPASTALFMIGKPAVPDLLEAIAASATSHTARNNAVLTIFLIYREDISEAVRVLKRAAKAKESTDWEASQRLIDAARKTAGMCRLETRNTCMEALFSDDKD